MSHFFGRCVDPLPVPTFDPHGRAEGRRDRVRSVTSVLVRRTMNDDANFRVPVSKNQTRQTTNSYLFVFRYEFSS
jgi:hypothetical protein